jgi:ribose transport system substrate-binding protein
MHLRDVFKGFALTAIAILIAVGSTAVIASVPAGASTKTPSSDVAYAKAQVAKYSKLTVFTAPGGKITRISQLKGSTIYFIPYYLEAPYFAAEASSLQQAAGVAGVKVMVCNAEGSPALVTTCFQQAIAAQAKGIITDSIDYSLAPNGYAAAAKAGIPVVAAGISDAVPSSLKGHAVTYGIGTPLAGRLSADAVISASNGKAHALLVVTHYTPLTTQNAGTMASEFKQRCPGCVVSTSIYSDVEVAKVVTEVSTALDQIPAINYLIGQFDDPAGPGIVQGMQVAHRSNVKEVTQGASLAGLQRVASGAQIADVSSDPDVNAWNEMDIVFRMATKSQVPAIGTYTIAQRVFTKSNIGSITLTNAASANGSWFSNGSFRKIYTKLWTSK